MIISRENSITMPSVMKKNDYESKGFVRRLMEKGASFKSLGGESLNDSFNSSSFGRFRKSDGIKWRPRKNQFELLDCNDDDSLSAAFQHDSPSSWNIQNTISSAESETGEYRRDIMFEEKVTALKKTSIKKKNTERKRELSPIKPPCKDTTTIRAPTSFTKNTPQKKQRQYNDRNNNEEEGRTISSSGFADTVGNDLFSTDPFGFAINHNVKKHPTVSHHIENTSSSSRKQPHSSYNSVASDPTDFFSKERATKLTTGNLAKMESTFNSIPKNPASDGIETLVKERKFYQFAIDEDKESTVVESIIKLPADYPGGDYSIDDSTAISCDETSQGTRIQSHSVASQQRHQSINHEFESVQDILPNSSHSRKHAEEVKEFDSFFPTDVDNTKGRGEIKDPFFPSSGEKDGFFPDFTEKETHHIVPASESDISSFGGDRYFDSRRSQQASSKSLAYSISPVHNNFVPPQNGRQPLSLKKSQSDSGRKNMPFQASTVHTKTNKNNSEWFVTQNFRESEDHFQFTENLVRPSSTVKKRHSSISSSNFQPPPADPFDSIPSKVSAKENFHAGVNRNKVDDDNAWGIGRNKPAQQSLGRGEFPMIKNLCDDDFDSGEDDDSFDDIDHWERPVGAPKTSIGRAVIASQNRTNAINRTRFPRRSHDSYNRPSRNQYLDDYDDDARSTSGFSVGKVSRPSAGSRMKPLALPSNAIMASMLFQTQHDIDQNDVQEKINAFEQENSRQRKIRNSQGGIPDAVNMDDDYMTTISSFSEGTSAYLQENWRKPSRDLLNHFTSARALDMEYRRLPVRRPIQTDRQQGLYEA